MTQTIQADTTTNNEIAFEEGRLKTFKDWPYKDDGECTARKMAEAGFIFSGSNKEPDLAECFVCLKKLDGWEREDDPWEEHKKHASNCPFVKLGKKEIDMTYADLLFLCKERAISLVKAERDEAVAEVNKLANAVRNKIKKLQKKKKK